MGLKAYEGKLNHISIKMVSPRSTLSGTNKQRPAAVFQEIFNYLNSKYKVAISDSILPNEVLSRLFLVGPTVFPLFKAILKTSGRHSANGKKKGGIKRIPCQMAPYCARVKKVSCSFGGPTKKQLWGLQLCHSLVPHTNVDL